MPDFRAHHTLLAHSAAITATRYSPQGHILATASADATVHLWDTSDPARAPFHQRSLKGQHTRGINDIAWNKDGSYLATASDDGTAVIWSVRKGTPLRILRGHTSHILCLAFHPKSNILATGGWDESVILWNIQRGTKIKTLQAHSDPVSSLAYNPDGTMIVTGSHDGLMRLWDATTGQCLKTIEDDQNAPISHASFTPNGQYIISSALSSTIRLWDYRHARVIKTFTGHRSARFGSGVGLMDARAWGGEVEEGRVAKRRKVQEEGSVDGSKGKNDDAATQAMESGETEAEAPTSASKPHQPSTETPQDTQPAPLPPLPTSDTAYLITGTDTATAIIYDLQSRHIIGCLNPRFPSDGSGDPMGEGTTAQRDTGEDDEAVVAIGVHPFRREVAVGGLGDGRAVRVWRDWA
ncbi:hypothetical protein NliqN6_0128 [Naganishia liquefaciens]|uniref:WDR5-like beta-propeller domain-containing protein n=1 Tax=Naganishia liquefaciens TaxID=104408 RepID=A0A8H3YDF1_9TREE|nr:hypothetical protein NliqN6_0128 [Naganishia liquefaciens]